MSNKVLGSDLWTRPRKVQLDRLDLLVAATGLVSRVVQGSDLRLCTPLQFRLCDLQVHAVTANERRKPWGFYLSTYCGNKQRKEPNLETTQRWSTRALNETMANFIVGWSLVERSESVIFAVLWSILSPEDIIELPGSFHYGFSCETVSLIEVQQ